MSKLITLLSGLKIPQVGLGVFKTVGEDTPEIIYKSLELGYRHFDSAQYYENEEAVAIGISRFLADYPKVKRSEIFFTTKVNPLIIKNYLMAKKSIEESLEKTKSIEYVDLFLVHAPLVSTEDLCGIYQAIQEAADLGKVKSIGVSNYGIKHLKALLEWPGLKYKPVVNQVELNPWLTRKELIDFMTGEGIIAEAYSPLTRGYRLNDPELVSLSEKYNKSSAQILIRWCLQKNFIVLPKSSNAKRLAENMDVFDFEISEEDMVSLTHDDEYYVTIPAWDPSTS